MRKAWLLAVTITLAALSGGYARAQSGYDLFQQALVKERAEGNLDEAIKLYQRIVREYASDRTLAAKALIELGQCYEKLGNTEARKAYERVLRDYADQNEAASQARARLAALSGAAKTTEMVTRRVWAGPDVDPEGGVSRDGRYITYPDWDTGDLAVFDLATGEKRRITQKGTWSDNDEFAEFSAPSPDGKQIAYAWYKDDVYELRIIGIDGSRARTIFRNDNVTYIEPMAWSPSGDHIFAAFYQKDDKMQVVSVSVVDGSERVFKTFPPRPFAGITMSLSPDGRYLVYDFPQSDNSSHRDISCLSTEGSWEAPLIEHPADDGVFGWAPDGRSILFTSDRTGQTSIWTLELAEGKPKGAPRLLKPDAGRVLPLGVTQKGTVYYGMAAGIREMYTAELDFASGKLLSPPKPVTQLFTGKNSSPDWSPDGSRLAYLSVRRRTDRYGWGQPADTIVIRTLETGEEREIVLDPVSVASFQGLRWAPDGRSLLVKGWSNDNKRGAYRVDAETGKLTPLIQEDEGQFYSLPQLTPDNKAFVSSRMGSGEKVSRIVVHDLESGHERELVRRISPAGIRGLDLSPDGRQLAFSTGSERGGFYTLNVVPLSGGEAHELLRVQQPDAVQWNTIGWTPDGRYIVFGQSHEGSKDPLSLKTTMWKIAVQGGKPEKLELTMDTIRPLRIHPDGRRVAFAAGFPAWEVWVMENFLPVLKAAR